MWQFVFILVAVVVAQVGMLSVLLSTDRKQQQHGEGYQHGRELLYSVLLVSIAVTVVALLVAVAVAAIVLGLTEVACVG